MSTNDYPEAPIAAGAQLGKLTIRMEDEVVAELPLIAAANVDEASFFGRFIGRIKLFFTRLLG